MGRSIGTWILLLRKLVSKIRNMLERLETVLEGSAALYYKGLSSSVRQKLWLLEYQEVVCWQGLIELDRSEYSSNVRHISIKDGECGER